MLDWQNINSDRDIKVVRIVKNINREEIDYKAGAFAVDVGVVCGGDIVFIYRIDPTWLTNKK